MKIAFENYFVWKRSWWARREGKESGRFLGRGRESVGGGGGPDQQQQQEEVCVRCVCACDSGHDDVKGQEAKCERWQNPSELGTVFRI